MIDLHCHILHALDDGPKLVNESIQIAQSLAKCGYRVVVATPHMVPGTAWMPSVEAVTTQIKRLNESMRLANFKLEILPGMEIALDPQIPELLFSKSLLSLGDSRYLLIEPPFQQLPPGWQSVLFSIMTMGYKILLAHPERCAHLAARLDLVEELINAGIYLQVNWGSFIGVYGQDVKRTAKTLAQCGWIHCLATDCHQPQKPSVHHIQAAGRKLGEVIGRENLRLLTVENPMKILNDKTLQPMVVTPRMAQKNKKQWWHLW